jgi:DNA-directed RNA polymerase subunit RPC12/RpoP
MEEKTACPHCNHHVNKSSYFCENCGSELSANKHAYQTGQPDTLDEFGASRTNNRNQTLIFIGILALCASSFYYFFIGLIVDISDNWEIYDTVRPVSLFLNFVTAGVALIIAFGMTSGTKKTLAIVFGCAYAIVNLYWLVEQLIPDEPAFDYLQF